MKKIFLTIITVFAFAIIPNFAFAFSSEIHVTKDGQATMSNAKVVQIAGSTIFARLYWGDAFIRFTIKTNSKTTFLRATGEATTIAEIKEGDILDTIGELETGSNTLNLVATSIKNASVQKEQSTLSGTVTNVNLSARQFTLDTKDRGEVTVTTGVTTPYKKGSRTLDIGSLRIGDYVSKTFGDYDYATKTLVAEEVTIYIDMSIFKPQNFAGKLLEDPTILNDGSATLKILLGNTAYIANLPSDAIVMRSNRNLATLQRFIGGDSIRVYGVIQEIDDPVIDVEVIRNMSL